MRLWRPYTKKPTNTIQKHSNTTCTTYIKEPTNTIQKHYNTTFTEIIFSSSSNKIT